MARINKIHIHNPENIRVKQDEVEDTRWVSIFVDDFEVVIFDADLEDLRAALYRSDMEVYDADSA